MNKRSDRFVQRLRRNVGAPEHVSDQQILEEYKGSLIYAITDLGQAADDLKSACRSSISRSRQNDV
jgi:hypothetical protein